MAYSVPVENQAFLHNHQSSNLLQAPAPSHHASQALAQHQLYQQQRAVQQAAQHAAAHQTAQRGVQPLAPPPFGAQHLQLAQPHQRQPPRGISPHQPLLNPARTRTQQPTSAAEPVFENHNAQSSAMQSAHPGPIAQLAAEPASHREFESRTPAFQIMGGAQRLAAPSSSIPQLLSAKLADTGMRRWNGAAPYQNAALPDVPSAAQARGRAMRQYGDANARAFSDEGGGANNGGDHVGGQGMLGHHWFGAVGEPMPGMSHDGDTRGVMGSDAVGALSGAGVLAHGLGDARGSAHRDERSRLALVRPQFKPASDDEKRERHNKHTKQSRKRIDDCIKELREALKKVRPNVKLGHKAEIVGEAVKFVLDMYQVQQTTQMMDSSLSN